LVLPLMSVSAMATAQLTLVLAVITVSSCAI
jgi:hypothetical protein